MRSYLKAFALYAVAFIVGILAACLTSCDAHAILGVQASCIRWKPTAAESTLMANGVAVAHRSDSTCAVR